MGNKKEHYQEILPHQQVTEVAERLGLFLQNHLLSPNEPTLCTYKQNTDDFGIEIKELLLSKTQDYTSTESNDNPSQIDDTIEDMKSVSERLAIKIKLSKRTYHLRDLWMRTATGDLITQRNSLPMLLLQDQKLMQAIEKAIDLCIHCNQTGFARSSNPFLKGVPGNFYGDVHLIDLDDSFYFNDRLKNPLAFCAEGGNLLTLSNRKGVVKLLVGEFQLFASLNAYLLENSIIEKAASEPISQMVIQKIADSLSPQVIKGFIEEMRVQKISTPEKETDLEKLRMVAAKYLWQKHYIHGIIGANFNIPPEDVIFVPQVYYHLDNFLKSGPSHSVFMCSHELTARFLEEVQNHADVLKLSAIDRQHIERYIQSAWKLDRELRPLLEVTSEILKSAGFDPIPMPGIFMDAFVGTPRDSKTCNINFMNALSGWSPKTQNYYFITNGAQVGDRLGVILMDMFDACLKYYQPEIEVYFVGGKDFSEPMVWWNTYAAQFGIHCLTFELKTASHQR